MSRDRSGAATAPTAGQAVTVAAAAVAAGAGAATVVDRYRRDVRAAWARLDEVERDTVATPAGVVEYAVRGTGEPVLVSHGIFHGCDGALMSVRELVVGRRVVAPSRFGYLGSDLPPDARPADQADAFAALLDHLDLDTVDVVGISAGATAALWFALRHPDRVDHLVVLAGNLPGGTTAVQQPAWAAALYTDAAMWALRTALPTMMARLSGVPAGFECSPVDQRFVDELVESLFPVAPRAAGIGFDAFVSNEDVNRCPLEEIAVPTLLVHARDDPLASFDAAADAATRIPDARLLDLTTGGHLTLGQSERVRDAIEAFLWSR